MQGMELVEDQATRTPSPGRAKQLLEATKSEGLLVGLGGFRGNVVRLGPSMLITATELDLGLDRLRRACETVSAS